MRLALAVTIGCLITGAARADELVATKPGIMCASADALGRLTLPNGDSRTHGPHPAPADRATASSGGCVDIAPGQHVTTVESFRNTSIAMVDGMRLTIPNADFQPAAATAGMAPAIAPPGTNPAGYKVTVHLPLAGGNAIEVLEDSRISPQLRKDMWSQSDNPADSLPDNSPLSAAFAKQPARPARVRIVDAKGAILAEQTEEEPLANLEQARWKGLPAPTYLLTVDHSVGMGSYAGPTTTLLTPTLSGLTPERHIAPHGRPATLSLASTPKSAWKVVPSRTGGPDEIEEAFSRPKGSGDDFVTYYRTYRLVGGTWQMAERQKPGIWENEVFPPRSDFP